MIQNTAQNSGFLDNLIDELEEAQETVQVERERINNFVQVLKSAFQGKLKKDLPEIAYGKTAGFLAGNWLNIISGLAIVGFIIWGLKAGKLK